MQTCNQYLNHLIDPSFQGVSRVSVLSFENDAYRRSYKRYFLPTAEIKDCDIMIDEIKFFNQPIKNDLITYENIGKIATGPGDEYITGCLLDYNYFKNYYKMVPIDLSKQQEFGANSRAIQQINFTANLD